MIVMTPKMHHGVYPTAMDVPIVVTARCTVRASQPACIIAAYQHPRTHIGMRTIRSCMCLTLYKQRLRLQACQQALPSIQVSSRGFRLASEQIVHDPVHSCRQERSLTGKQLLRALRFVIMIWVLPWSKSCPNGDELLVRLACLPSMQSRWRYTSPAKPFKKYTHHGATSA